MKTALSGYGTSKISVVNKMVVWVALLSSFAFMFLVSMESTYQESIKPGFAHGYPVNGTDGKLAKDVKPRLAKVAVPFIENKGQVKNEAVKFYANTLAGTVFLTKKGEIVYSLQSANNNRDSKNGADAITDPKTPNPEYANGWVIKEKINGLRNLRVNGVDKAEAKINYFIGNDKKNWKSNIPAYNSVSLGEIYKGIELVLKAYGKNVEKLFIVNPGADVSEIEMSLEGANSITINKSGELEMETGIGLLKFTKPNAYQEINGKRRNVAARFIVRDPEGTYGFEVSSYDKNRPLIIDPLLASTFIGGNGSEVAASLAVDGSGNVYVAGWTESNNFPVTTGGAYNGGKDVFVSRLNAGLSALSYSTYIGGSASEEAASLAVDGTGNVYVAGWTESNNFPVTTGGAFNGGVRDGFISRLNTGLTLLSSSYIGGSGFDDAASLAVDGGSGNVYMTGITNSSNFPVTTGGALSGSSDAFVTRLNAGLTILASTFIGGVSGDGANDLAIDGSGNVIVAGGTNSSNFPSTAGATYNGGSDIFVSRLNAGLNTVLASTMVGGSFDERADALTIDGSGNVYVTGATGGLTNTNDYPVTAEAYDQNFNGLPGFFSYNLFISRLNSGLNLTASTFLGGYSNTNEANAIAVDGSGNVLVAGIGSIPTTTGAYDTVSNSGDGFVSRLTPSLNQLIASTFIGGEDFDGVSALVVGNTGNIYIAGATSSLAYPATPGAYDTTLEAWADAYVSILSGDLSAGGTYRAYVPSGSNVFAGVPPFPIAPWINYFQFQNIATAGVLTVSESGSPSSPPANFSLVAGRSYQITFTGSFTNNVTAAFNYNESELSGSENNLQLYRRGNQGWINITTYVDTVNNVIYGNTTSFSEYALVEPVVPTGANTGWLLLTGFSLMLAGGYLFIFSSKRKVLESGDKEAR